MINDGIKMSENDKKELNNFIVEHNVDKENHWFVNSAINNNKENKDEKAEKCTGCN